MRHLLPLSFFVAFTLPACSGGNATPTPRLPDGVWIDRTRGTEGQNQMWTDVASDASGTHLVASSTFVVPPTSRGGCWTSSDGSRTWTLSANGCTGANTVASNATGTLLLAASSEDGLSGVLLSTSSGSAWSESAAPGPVGELIALASDASGAHLVAMDDSGPVWTSGDSGGSWSVHTLQGPAQQWVAVASDSTGARLVAVSEGSLQTGGPAGPGDIWTSSDFGATWTDRTPSGPAHDVDWTSVASDGSGSNLVAVGNGVWTSVDAGVTWIRHTTGAAPDSWSAVASDATGARLVAASQGPGSDDLGELWVSTNAGVTWTDQTSGTSAHNRVWSAVASDASGEHLVAVSKYGDIWANAGVAP